MATYELIEHIEVGSGGAASIEFSSISEDYTDLMIKLSFRSDAIAAYDPILLRFNGSDTGYSGTVIETAVGSFTTSESVTTATSAQATGTWARVTGTGVDTDQHTANTFGNAQIYITNYRKSINKSFSCDTVAENNATQAPLEITANLWSNTAAITSVALALKDGNIKQYSSATLFGIRKYNTASAPKATGGIVSYDAVNNKWVHTFTASGTFTPTEDLTAEYLVVAGGGGGGYSHRSGGAGSGGLRSTVDATGGGGSLESALSLTASTGYTVTIGAGGTGGDSSSAGNGNDSVFASITSTGGGNGAGRTYYGPSIGGSGGGGDALDHATGAAGTTNQGYAGGNGDNVVNFRSGGGGGGAGQAGVNGGTATDDPGEGGNGVAVSISGSSTYYAGGGGASAQTPSGAAGGLGGGGDGASFGNRDATVNTGGGGGAGDLGTNGGNGGSGIVIVRYSA